MLPTRMQILEKLIRFNNYKSIVEIGIKKGDTAIYLLDRVKEIETYIMIDPDDSVLDRHSTLYKYPNKCQFYKLTSVECSKLIEDNSIDLVFIDADHSYESVKEDIEHWISKVRKGGILSGHDYSTEHKECFGVVKAVDEIFKTNVNLELEQEPDGDLINIWWLYV